MDLGSWLAIAGASVTTGLGLMGLLAPDAAAKFTSVRPEGLIGRSEIRATYGGLFTALGVTCLAMPSPAAHAVAGTAWMGAAAGRMLSVVVDRSRSAKNLGGIAFEAAIGGLLLAGAWPG